MLFPIKLVEGGEATVDTTKAARTLIIVAVFLVALFAYWQLTVPGYFKGVELCGKGCHVTSVLDYEKINHPFWCIGCHGFGVKSEILPGIPLYRDHELEMLVEEHGECLMCHRVPGEFHWKHINATEEDLAKLELMRPVQCTDCHTTAYHGGHKDRPKDDVCLKCHDAEKLHPDMNKKLVAACTKCHSEEPAVDWAIFKKGQIGYGFVADAGLALAADLGVVKTTAPGCLLCHNIPETQGHLKHMGKEYNGKRVECLDCHKNDIPHGEKIGTNVCLDCHNPKETKCHDKGFEEFLLDCYRCHGGFALANETLYLAGKGCEGCHGDTLEKVVGIGLHSSHIPYYACSKCHDVESGSHSRFVESASDPEKCLDCHTKAAGVKSEALQGLRTSTALSFSEDIRHVELVEKAKGNCLKCHDEWHVAGKPRIIYGKSKGEGS
ncbi:hypothetical protein Pdsh_01720 [Pyrodictium delaneyi]|uniref:Uncharacterized protein n=1 Tax=Pyrodictium delaneyi TaxID=1273541 RepID=A0A211YR64_9CREN|nr:hypothetical protein Pdsh_01720 [Pyrodictium delaneyi]